MIYKLFACLKKHQLCRKRLGLHLQIFGLAGAESSSQRPYNFWNEYFG